MVRRKEMADTTNRNRPLMVEFANTPVDEGIRNSPVAVVVLTYSGEDA
jgi:hypothetical protein